MDDGGFGPGIGAFAVFFILAIVLWLLMRNMNARLRRMTYADRQAERGTAPTPVAEDRDRIEDSGSAGHPVKGD